MVGCNNAPPLVCHQMVDINNYLLSKSGEPHGSRKLAEPHHLGSSMHASFGALYSTEDTQNRLGAKGKQILEDYPPHETEGREKLQDVRHPFKITWSTISSRTLGTGKVEITLREAHHQFTIRTTWNFEPTGLNFSPSQLN